MTNKKHILFLCVANSARSQMAEGLARNMYPEFEFSSAGSNPTRPNPFAIQALSAKGIDISSHTSDAVADIDPETVDLVITLCAEEVCPVFLGDAPIMNWPFPDPDRKNEELSDDERLKIFCDTRDAIEQRLRLLSVQSDAIAPILISDDVDAALARYSAMGFPSRAFIADGKTIYGFVCTGANEFHIALASEVDPLTNSSAAYIYVNDVDVLYETWLAMDVPGRLHAPTDTDYGLREMAYVDPNGNLLRIGAKND